MSDTIKKLLSENLCLIKDIKFTSREVDIISAILNNRGEKKIANLLSISPRTVSSHVHNIMLKINKNSKDGIIDFIQDAGMTTEFNNHYQHIIVQNNFKNCLYKIKKEIVGKDINFAISKEDQKSFDLFEADLKLAGINLKQEEQNPSSTSLKNYLKDFEEEDYYFKIFALIEKITASNDIAAIADKFRAELSLLEQPHSTSSSAVGNKKISSRKYYLGLFCIVFSLLISFFTYHIAFKKEGIIARSNLMIPHKDIIIERKALMKKLSESLFDKNKISVVLLAGKEGTGKTVLARIYAQSQNSPIIWEVDGSNATNMLASFEKLAYFLLENKEDREELEFIEKVTAAEVKIKKLEYFLSKKARKYPNWLIIYDNISSFSLISKYFPHDNKVWGNGSVIVTTRNADIDFSEHFGYENVINIGELSKTEKTQLFDNILSTPQVIKDKYYRELIDNVPPYPLDVLHVASFIKKEKISCENYLSYLRTKPGNSTSADNDYLEARNKIVSRSLDQILKINPEFLSFLVITSSVANYNIPKDLLDFAYGKDIASKFINEMQKFAFIDMKNSDSKSFSMHHATQEIIKSYVKNLDSYKDSATTATKILNDYFTIRLNQNNIEETKITIPHIEAFLNNNLDIINTKPTAELYLKLAESFFDLASYKIAELYYKRAELIYKKYYSNYHPKIALLYSKLGILNRNTVNYNEAKNYLEKALESNIKIYTPNNEKVGKNYVQLGSVYWSLKDLSKALDYTQNGIKILKSAEVSNIEMTRAEAYLAAVYTSLKRYDLARPMLEKAVPEYQAYYQDTHTKTAWVKIRLAIVYYHIGMFDEAINLITQARETYKNYCGENSMEYAWSTKHLGIIYNKLGKYKEANDLINTAIRVYMKYFSVDHPIIIRAKSQLKNI